MSLHNRKRLGRTLIASASVVLVFGTGLAAAAPAAPALSSPAPFGMAQATVLKHLPAGQNELTFRGEAAQRAFGVYLTRDEPDQTRVFQIGFKNAVTTLPERSFLKLIVNDQLLATIPINSPNVTSVVPVTIPSGTLKPGPNKVEFSVVMAHRVDCSVSATYELWTLVDAAKTGFLVPAAGGEAVGSIEEIAGEALAAADGTTHIFLRTRGIPDAAEIGRAGHFIDALVSRAGLVRPIVEVGSGEGRGAGFDVVLTTGQVESDAVDHRQDVGGEDDLRVVRDPATKRLALTMSGLNQADLERHIASFASKGSQSIVPATGEAALGDGARMSFAELGFRTQQFTGRHYNAVLSVQLPADFYPANYDKARLMIDGAYATNLDRDSELIVRVNGKPVSSFRLGPEKDGELRHETVELPLRFFHPGFNEIAIEGIVTMPFDRQCDAAGAPADTRFSLSDTSEIEFPHFAHIGTSPQIPSALQSLRGGGRESVPLYLPNADLISVGSGLTVLANMSADRHMVARPAVHFGSPAMADAPGIVVAPWTSLPDTLSASLHDRFTAADQAPASRVATPNAKPFFDPADPRPLMRAASLGMNLMQRSIDLVQRSIDTPALLDGADHLLQRQGFLFGDKDDATTVPVTARTLLVAAVDPRLQEHRIAGIDVPRFAADLQQWLVVTASDKALLKAGLDRMISDGQWTALQGRAVSLDIDKGTVASVQPSQVLYVVPDKLTLSDIRPILGGILSNNIELSLAALLVLMALLGVSTHGLVRRAGSR